MNLSEITNFIINFFQTIPIYYLHSFGYFFVFLSAIIEAIPFFGTLLPGQTIIIISGILAYNDLMNLYILLILASLGAIIGDSIAFWMGSKWGSKFIKKYGKYLLIDEKRNKYIQKLMKKNLGKTILIGRFNSATRAFTPFLAGSMNINFFKFSIWNIITGILWSSTWVLVGYFAGKSFEIVVKYLSYGILIATILSIIIWFLFKYLKDKKHIYSKFEIPIIITNIFSIYIFSKMIEDIINLEPLLNLDLWISNNILNLWNPVLNTVIIFITNFADKLFIIFFSIILIWYLLKNKKYQKIYFYLLSIITGTLAIIIIKNIIQKLRPQNSLITLSSYSFPSAHTTMATIISICLFFIFKDELKNKQNNNNKYYLFLSLIILYPIIIGFSRIFLNVHYFSDVIGGISLGIIIVTNIYLLQKYLLKTKKIKSN